MRTISSADFRINYHRLNEATHVTANGHVIGTWYPAVTAQTRDQVWTLGQEPPEMDIKAERQARRDEILRKINKG